MLYAIVRTLQIPEFLLLFISASCHSTQNTVFVCFIDFKALLLYFEFYEILVLLTFDSV
jgi:hypothetical protein